MGKRFNIAVACAAVLVAADKAHAYTAHCFCKVSSNNLSGQTSASGVCFDITPQLNNIIYQGLNPQKEANQNDCRIHCDQQSVPYTGNYGIAACACAAGRPTGTHIYSYSAVGTAAYRPAHLIGALTNQPAMTTYTYQCPPTWYANATNVLGGVSPDGKCKKLSAKPIAITPLPPNGTPVGTYGFTWGDELWAYGTAANGGAAIPTAHQTPPSCHF